MNPNNVVFRFAPSPTGLLHAGNYRTAIFGHLFTKQQGGKAILRIEDTDRARSKQEYENNIKESLVWLGLEYDETYRQSEHALRHEELLRKLVEEGKAYVSKETPKEPGDRDEVIRFKNPNIDITFTDAVRGDITINTEDLGDFVIARSFTEPVYHLAVVIDDMDEGVTHVIRGEDHISNTPRHILIQRAIGAPTPVYAHLPLVLGQDKQKLSKRRGAKAITEYRDMGYVPEAMVNFLALVGWHPEDDRELFTFDELKSIFTLERIQKGGAVFDEAKLLWFNHEHIKRLSVGEFKDRYSAWAGSAPELPEKMWELLRNASQTLADAKRSIEGGEFDFLNGDISYAPELLTSGAKADAATVKMHLAKILELLGAMNAEDFTNENVKKSVFPYATEQGRASVLWPMRVALSGKEKSPDPFTLAEVLGREAAISRIEKALGLL